MRAASLSDLVYKAGQGGVTKATVSIVFDNRDARVSPPGYEHCEARWPLRASVGLRGALLRASTLSRLFVFSARPRAAPQTITVTRTIVIGGRNKYLVNGHAVQANTVADLFHAVQLNVNNPHFLIMQVRFRPNLPHQAGAHLCARVPALVPPRPTRAPHRAAPRRGPPLLLAGPHHQGAEHEAAGDPGHD